MFTVERSIDTFERMNWVFQEMEQLQWKIQRRENMAILQKCTQ